MPVDSALHRRFTPDPGAAWLDARPAFGVREGPFDQHVVALRHGQWGSQANVPAEGRLIRQRVGEHVSVSVVLEPCLAAVSRIA